jgi:hypothetical protein
MTGRGAEGAKESRIQNTLWCRWFGCEHLSGGNLAKADKAKESARLHEESRKCKANGVGSPAKPQGAAGTRSTSHKLEVRTDSARLTTEEHQNTNVNNCNINDINGMNGGNVKKSEWM